MAKAAPERLNRSGFLIKQKMIGRQWHQLDHIANHCTSLQTDNHASTSSLKLFTGLMLFLSSNQRRKSTEGIVNVLCYLRDILIYQNLSDILTVKPRSYQPIKSIIYFRQ